MLQPKCIWEAQAQLGESPLWVESENALYWVDIKAPCIFRYEAHTGKKTMWPLHQKIGCLVYSHSQGFLAAMECGFVKIKFGVNGAPPDITPIIDPEPSIAANRFNDGKLDPQGRFIAGTMDDLEQDITGSWWQLDDKGHVRLLDGSYKVTNGPAFDPKIGRIYLTDSAAQTIFAADYSSDGVMQNKRVFLQFSEGDGYPDGMTTDKYGNLWVAFWDGDCIRQFSRDGKLINTYSMPVPRPTSMTFDSKEHTIYITSARIGLSEDEIRKAPLSGGLFTMRVH